MAVPDHRSLLAATDSMLDDAECWQRAEWHLLTAAFLERLETGHGIAPTPDAGATLVAAALFLAEHTDEWGDARDILAELAQLGRALLDS